MVYKAYSGLCPYKICMSYVLSSHSSAEASSGGRKAATKTSFGQAFLVRRLFSSVIDVMATNVTSRTRLEAGPASHS